MTFIRADLFCRYCNEDSQETQEHIKTCGGCEFERRGLDGVGGDLLEAAKITATAA